MRGLAQLLTINLIFFIPIAKGGNPLATYKVQHLSNGATSDSIDNRNQKRSLATHAAAVTKTGMHIDADWNKSAWKPIPQWCLSIGKEMLLGDSTIRKRTSNLSSHSLPQIRLRSEVGNHNPK